MGIFLSLVFGGVSFSTVSHVESKSGIESPQRIFTKGDKAEGKFKAVEQRLGILEIRFDKYNGVNYTGNDVLMFRIKEDGARDWFYQNVYSINEFEKTFLLPFGFPIAENSKDKQYDFEIESLSGNGINSVRISKTEPVFLSVYQFPKREILSPSLFIHFLYTKTVFSLENIDFWFSSVLYFIPFLFYILWVVVRNRINMAGRFLAYLSILFVFLDSFLIAGSHTGIILFIMGTWIAIIFIYKLESSVTFLISLLLFIIVTFLVLFKTTLGAEKLQVYIYAFLVLGVIQSVYELKDKPKKLVDFKQFLKGVLNINEK